MTPISHPVEQEELMAYLDGELPADRASLVAKHVEQCTECRAFVTDFRGVSRQMGLWQVESSPARLAEKVGQAVQIEHPAAGKAKSEKPRRVFRWTLAFAAGAAATLAVVAVLVPNLLRSRQAASVQMEPMYQLSVPLADRGRAGAGGCGRARAVGGCRIRPSDAHLVVGGPVGPRVGGGGTGRQG